MTCDFRGPCRPYPICHLCGACGKHCGCPDSPAQDAAGRTETARVRAIYQAEAVEWETRCGRYARRWKEMKGAIDIVLQSPTVRPVVLAELRKQMDRPLYSTHRARSAGTR